MYRKRGCKSGMPTTRRDGVRKSVKFELSA
jgi:hypothetical protein